MTGPRRIVVALGGNALQRRGESLDVGHLQANVTRAAEAIAALCDDDTQLVVTHGNGPQVGLLALQAEAYRDVPPYPLDVLGAESEGMIGYLLDQHLSAELPDRRVATLLTQVVVSPHDPAFAAPTKPIGPVYPAADAERLARERGWSTAPDGDGVRRVVPSPTPGRIVELPTIRLLLDHGTVVVCAGGGGIPVLNGAAGLRGVEAVIDKDATAAVVARDLGADALLILTDVPAVRTGWASPSARAILRASPEALRRFTFAAGSMGPKVTAACRFVQETGHRAAIGRLEDAAALLAGTAGTQILPRVPLALAPDPAPQAAGHS